VGGGFIGELHRQAHYCVQNLLVISYRVVTQDIGHKERERLAFELLDV
jgi:hypothetical protein